MKCWTFFVLISIPLSLLSSSLIAAEPEATISQKCVLREQTENYSLQMCGPVKVLKLRGTPLKRAEIYGRLMGEGKISKEVLNFYGGIAEALTAEKPILKPLKGAINGVLNLYASRLWNRAPKGYAEEIEALAKGAGFKPAALKRIYAVPDIGTMMAGFLAAPRAEFGCTSASYAIPGGSVVAGRNWDYGGGGIYDLYPMVTVIEPEAGSRELRHVNFSADGIHFGTVSGINEAGLLVTTHQVFSRTKVTATGVPLYILPEIVLREARNLAEAESILRRYRTGPAWFVTVMDLRTGHGISVETSRDRLFVRRSKSNEVFAQTNHLQQPGAENWETASYGRYLESRARYSRTQSLLSASIDPGVARVAKALSFQKSPGDLNPFEDTLKPDNIHTLLVEATSGTPSDIETYFGFSRSPTASGKFLKISLADYFEFETGNLEYSEWALPVKERVRDRQVKVATLYGKLVTGDDSQALDVLAEQNTPSAKLAMAAIAFKRGSYHGGAEYSSQASSMIQAGGVSDHTVDSLVAINLLSRYKLGQRDFKESELVRLENSKNWEYPVLARQLRAGRVKSRFLAPIYDFFGGDLVFKVEH